MFNYRLLAICMQKNIRYYKTKKINIFFRHKKEKNKSIVRKSIRKYYIDIYFYAHI